MSDRGTVKFVYAVTAALALAGGWYVATYGSSVPVMDEWDLLAEWQLFDSTAKWLVAHHNEHRYPLTKALWLGGLRLTGFNAKPLLFVPLGLLVAASVLLLKAARAARGQQHPADALVPALLLHWGHGFNWLMAYQLGFALVAFAVAGWVWCAARGRLVGSLAFAALLVPCGGFGVAFTPAVVMWCAWVARHSGRLVAALAITVGVGTAAYTGWVVATLPAAGIRPTAAPLDFVAAATGELCVALGTWPVRESVAVRVVLAVAVLGVYVWAIVRAWRTRENPVSVAALAVILGSALTAAAMAYARGIGFTARMGDASAAGLAVAWVAATAGLRVRPMLAGITVLAVGGALFAANFAEGKAYGVAMRHPAYRVNRDIRAGLPPFVIAGRHGHAHAVLVGENLALALKLLKEAGIHPFTLVADDPPLDPVPLPADALPAQLSTGEFDLPEPPPGTYALRLRAFSSSANGRDRVLLLWAGHEEEAWVPPSPRPVDLVFPIRDRRPALRLVVGPSVRELRLDAAEWLVRPAHNP